MSITVNIEKKDCEVILGHKKNIKPNRSAYLSKYKKKLLVLLY